jgi:hypothetical protein
MLGLAVRPKYFGEFDIFSVNVCGSCGLKQIEISFRGLG